MKKVSYADDDTASIASLVKLRVPSLMVGLALGVLLPFVISGFRSVLLLDIEVAFFIPFIVYMADAVGTQTQSIYVRDLRTGKADFKRYLVKEMALGVILGILSSLITFLVVRLWFGEVDLALAVALGMLMAIVSAPVIALLVTELLQLERLDPAVGAGPIATVIQDTASVLIYGLVVSQIIL